ncbi:hypothetical protein V9T40_005151 [Parthenolecanium corni]|uniref:RNA-directed DNA polymerase n=1 Tax=Parthenolecanium corni TaxID=536013 RepID=A0AAN9TDB7_9HEMI
MAANGNRDHRVSPSIRDTDDDSDHRDLSEQLSDVTLVNSPGPSVIEASAFADVPFTPSSTHRMNTRQRTQGDPPPPIWPMTGARTSTRGRGRQQSRSAPTTPGRGFSPRPGAGRGYGRGRATPTAGISVAAEVHDVDPTLQFADAAAEIPSERSNSRDRIEDPNQYEPYVPPPARTGGGAQREQQVPTNRTNASAPARGSMSRGGASFRQFSRAQQNQYSSSHEQGHVTSHQSSSQPTLFEQQMATLMSSVNATLVALNARVSSLEGNRIPEPRVHFGVPPVSDPSRRSSASPASGSFEPNHSSTQRLAGENSYASLPRMPRLNTYTFEASDDPPDPNETGGSRRSGRGRERMWRSVFQHFAGDEHPEKSFVLEELESGNSVSDSITKAFLRKKSVENFQGDNDRRTVCEFIREFDRAFTCMPDNRNRCDMLRAHIDENACKWTKQNFAMTLSYLDLCVHLLKLYWRPQKRHQLYGKFIHEIYDERGRASFEDYVTERYYQLLDTRMLDERQIMLEFQHKCPSKLALIVTPEYFVDFPTLAAQLMLDSVLRYEKNRLKVFGLSKPAPYSIMSHPGPPSQRTNTDHGVEPGERRPYRRFVRPPPAVNAIASAESVYGAEYSDEENEYVDYEGYEYYFADDEEAVEEGDEPLEEKSSGVAAVTVMQPSALPTIPRWKDFELMGNLMGEAFFKAATGETNFNGVTRRTYEYELLNPSIRLDNLRDKIRGAKHKISKKVLIMLSGEELVTKPDKDRIMELLKNVYFELFQHHSVLEIVMAKPLPHPETSEQYWTDFSIVNAAYYHLSLDLPAPYKERVRLAETYQAVGRMSAEKERKRHLYFVAPNGAPRLTINEGSYQTVRGAQEDEETLTWSTPAIMRFNTILTQLLEFDGRRKEVPVTGRKELGTSQGPEAPAPAIGEAKPEAPRKVAEVAEMPASPATTEAVMALSSDEETQFEFLGQRFRVNEINSLCWSSEDEDDDLRRADEPVVQTENEELIIRPRIVEPRIITGYVGLTRATIFCDDGSVASFIPKAFVEKIIRENPTMKVVTFSQKPQIYGLAEPGKNMKKVDTLVHVRIELRNGDSSKFFQLVAEMPETFGHDVMFGRNVYDALRITYDYDTSEMVFGNRQFSDFRVPMRTPFICAEVAPVRDDVAAIIEEVISEFTLDEELKTELRCTFHRHAKIFDGAQFGRCNKYTHDFHLNAERIKSFQPKVYPIPQCEKERFREILQTWVDRTIVRDSVARFRSPILMVKKKDGDRRPCIDFRELNKVLEVRGETVPNIAELKTRFHGAQHFSKLDFKEGFLQIPLGESSKQYTAFSFEGKIYEFNVTPYGTMQSSQSFIKALQRVFCDMDAFVAVYVDDVLVFSKTEKEHAKHLELVFAKILDANMTLNPKKCNFFRTEVPYLGFIVSDSGIQADPERIQGLLNIPPPKDLRSLQSFLGLVNFYRDHIPSCAIICEPLHRLTHKQTPFVWSELQERSFEMLKSRIARHILLSHPDFERPFYVQTDASLYGIGGYVYQLTDENRPIIVAICSRLLNRAERNYGTYERELLALVYTIRKYYYMLLGHNIYLITDHQALVHLKGENNFKERLNRWRIELQNFNIVNICHVPGDKNIIADALSRFHKDFIVDTKALYRLPSVNVIMRNDHGNYELADVLEQLPRDQQVDEDCCKFIELAEQTVNSRFRMREGLLEYRNRDGKFRTFVPERWRAFLIQEYHLQSQHVGIVKTITILRRQFDWPGLPNEVRAAIKSCEECNLCKRRNLVPQGPQHNSIALEKNDYIAVDYFGPLPGARAGLSKILVVMDIFTKFVRLYPVKLMTTEATLKAMDKYVAEFGAPRRILSDNGRQFDNDRWKKYWLDKGTTPKFVATYRPASNPCERVMATLGDMLRLYTRDKHRRWPNLIKDIQNRINNTEHVTTRVLPCLLQLQKRPKVEALHELVDASDADRLLAEESARANIMKAVDQRRNAHMKRFKKQFELPRGHIVYVRLHQLSDKAKGEAKKLFALFDGPYMMAHLDPPFGHCIGCINKTRELEDLREILQATLNEQRRLRDARDTASHRCYNIEVELFRARQQLAAARGVEAAPARPQLQAAPQPEPSAPQIEELPGQPLDLARGHQPELERMSVDRPPLDERIDQMLNQQRQEVERRDPSPPEESEAARALRRQIRAQQSLRPHVQQLVQGVDQSAVSGSAMQQAAAALPVVPPRGGAPFMRLAVRRAMAAIPVPPVAAAPPAQVPVQNQLRPNLAVRVDPARESRAVGPVAPAASSPGAVRRSAEQQPPRPAPAVRQQQQAAQPARPQHAAEPQPQPPQQPRQPPPRPDNPPAAVHRQIPVGVPVEQIHLARQEVQRRAIDAYRYQQAALDRPTLRMRHPTRHVPPPPGAAADYNEPRSQTRRRAFELAEQERTLLLAEGRRIQDAWESANRVERLRFQLLIVENGIVGNPLGVYLTILGIRGDRRFRCWVDTRPHAISMATMGLFNLDETFQRFLDPPYAHYPFLDSSEELATDNASIMLRFTRAGNTIQFPISLTSSWVKDRIIIALDDLRPFITSVDLQNQTFTLRYAAEVERETEFFHSERRFIRSGDGRRRRIGMALQHANDDTHARNLRRWGDRNDDD